MFTLSSASAKEVNTAEMKKRKLESLQFQNEVSVERLFLMSVFHHICNHSVGFNLDDPRRACHG